MLVSVWHRYQSHVGAEKDHRIQEPNPLILTNEKANKTLNNLSKVPQYPFHSLLYVICTQTLWFVVVKRVNNCQCPPARDIKKPRCGCISGTITVQQGRTHRMRNHKVSHNKVLKWTCYRIWALLDNLGENLRKWALFWIGCYQEVGVFLWLNTLINLTQKEGR